MKCRNCLKELLKLAPEKAEDIIKAELELKELADKEQQYIKIINGFLNNAPDKYHTNEQFKNIVIDAVALLFIEPYFSKYEPKSIAKHKGE